MTSAVPENHLIGRTVLEPPEIARAIGRLAHEIAEHTPQPDQLLLLGIPTRGMPLAARLAARLTEILGRQVPVGSLDVTAHRDDLARRPGRSAGRTVLPPGGAEGRTVVLVDDVLCTGRTVRAALDALAEHGRPAVVRLAVLVDRGHRELPIRADHVGKNLPTATSQRVQVLLAEVDGQDRVLIEDDARSVQGAVPGHPAGGSAAAGGAQPEPVGRR